MSAILFILALVLITLFYGVAIYNRMVKSRTMVEESWSGIDVQLKRRTDLIPNLINSVKGYMKHETDLLNELTGLRSNSLNAQKPADQAKAETGLSKALYNLFAVAENYPDLKANQNFLDLQDELSHVEDEIQLARRYYNGTVRNNNILVQYFPNSIIANMFNFNKSEFFEMEDLQDRDVPEVNF